jgi:hypothetical protein
MVLHEAVSVREVKALIRASDQGSMGEDSFRMSHRGRRRTSAFAEYTQIAYRSQFKWPPGDTTVGRTPTRLDRSGHQDS